MIQKEKLRPIVKELREMIERSDLSQRRVEKKAGFSKGYLSRLLAQNFDLKVWHLLAVLDSVDSHPGEFFQRLYPIADGAEASAGDEGGPGAGPSGVRPSKHDAGGGGASEAGSSEDGVTKAGSSEDGAAKDGASKACVSQDGATSRFIAASRPLSRELDDVLRCLYGLGVESLSALRGRLDRCEKAVAELEASGFVGAGRERAKG